MASRPSAPFDAATSGSASATASSPSPSGGAVSSEQLLSSPSSPSAASGAGGRCVSVVPADAGAAAAGGCSCRPVLSATWKSPSNTGDCGHASSPMSAPSNSGESQTRGGQSAATASAPRSPLAPVGHAAFSSPSSRRGVPGTITSSIGGVPAAPGSFPSSPPIKRTMMRVLASMATPPLGHMARTLGSSTSPLSRVLLVDLRSQMNHECASSHSSRACCFEMPSLVITISHVGAEPTIHERWAMVSGNTKSVAPVLVRTTSSASAGGVWSSPSSSLRSTSICSVAIAGDAARGGGAG